MRKKWKEIRVLVGICAALGWWGVIYPELTLLPDTYQITSDEAVEEYNKESFHYEWSMDDTLYYDILKADKDSVVFKSKLWDSISALIEKWEK